MLFNFKFKSFSFVLLLLASFSFAQTGIGTSTPHASAKLHVSATDKGFLPPRVTLTAAADATTIPSPAEGLLVYNLGSVGLQPGYYYWNGTNWATIATASSPNQMVDYVSVSTIYQTSIGKNNDLIFTKNNGGNIQYNTSTGVFTLSANKTYLFQAQVRTNTPSISSSYIEYGFVDATTNAVLVNGTETITSSTTATAGYGSNPVINFIYTPTTNQTVKLRTTDGSNGTQAVVSGTANITQIGSSAIINPWVLSGNDVYNTSGNVGIGTSSPTEKLDVSGNIKATNFIGGEIPIYLSANKSSAQSIPHNIETIVTNWDGAGWFNNFPTAWNSTTGAWTCPRAGIYEFFFSAMLNSHAPSGIGNEFAVILSLNGVLQSIGDFWSQTTSTTRTPHASTNLIMSLNVGDIVTPRIYQNLTTNTAINTQPGRLYFQVKQLPSRINRQ